MLNLDPFVEPTPVCVFQALDVSDHFPVEVKLSS